MQITEVSINKVYLVILTIYLCLLFSDANNRLGLNLCVIIMIALTLLQMFLQNTIKMNLIYTKANIWSIVFLIFAVLSVVWSIYPVGSIAACRQMFKKTIIIVTICFNVNNIKKFTFTIRMYLLVCLVMMLKLSCFMFIQGKTYNDFWDDVCGIHFNTVAQLLALGIIIAFWFYRTCKTKWKYIYLLYIAYSYYHILITGSRKGMLMPIVSGIIYLILIAGTDLKKILKNIGLFVFAGSIIIYFLSKNIHIINRLTVIINLILSGEATDGSSVLRLYFIQLAKEMFMNSPVIGCGINTFVHELINILGLNRYSHNNYMEILSGLGIVGLITYYWYYIYLSLYSFKMRKKSELFIMIFTIIITLAIFEYGIVTYSILNYPILLTIISIPFESHVINRERTITN